MNSERIQTLVHHLESGKGARIMWVVAAIAAIIGLGVVYDLRAYRGFSSPEAMDAAQVARNLSEGHGFSTKFIRPFSIYLVQKHNHAATPATSSPTAQIDEARLNGPHPDLANAPFYPTVLAGLMKTWKPDWQIDNTKPFWFEGGQYRRYKPEFRIAIFNQVLLCVVALLVFFIARKLFDSQAGWLAALLTIGSSLLWQFSVSGLSTMLLLVIFLGLIWFLIKVEELGRTEQPAPAKLFLNAVVIGLLVGLGMLTRYSFGWLIVPVIGFVAWFGGLRHRSLALIASVVFVLVVSPWMLRNYSVSGTLFGTAGYAFAADTPMFDGDRLMQSLSPDFSAARWVQPCVKKARENIQPLLEDDLLATGGWAGVLFFAGLLLGWRKVAARRLRYFTMASLGILIIAEALGRTGLSDISPHINTENLLVLFVPLINIFGVAFFLTLLDQMKTSGPMARYFVIGVVVVLTCRPLVWADISKITPLAYPPYYPPEIQKVAAVMKPDELMMSDIPWAVAWYGNQQCVWNTPNAGPDFFALNDYVKPVHGLYLSTYITNSKLVTDCVRGNDDSWPKFTYKLLSPGLTAEERFPEGFPLKVVSPSGLSGGAGIFLTDRLRWLNK